MTESDLQRIEAELNIVLPSEYRETVLNYPVRFEIGNSSNTPLWDDADAIIRENKMLRTTEIVKGFFGYTRVGWPEHFFFIGGDFSNSAVIDLRQTPCRVLDINHWDVRPYIAPWDKAPLFSEWLDEYLGYYLNEGIDITASEDPVKPVPRWMAYAILVFFTIAFGGAALFYLLQALVARN